MAGMLTTNSSIYQQCLLLLKLTFCSRLPAVLLAKGYAERFATSYGRGNPLIYNGNQYGEKLKLTLT